MNNVSGIMIRPEKLEDYREVENLTREAFWDVYKPGCDEHLMVHKIRGLDCFIPELDLVAVQDNKIVGNIIYSRAKAVDKNNNEHELICFGPVSVLPSLQNKGIGSILINKTIEMAKEMGFKAIIIFGNPAYYHRFGFISAGNYGITTSDGQNFDAFMALELYKDSLNGISGRFFEDPVFKIDNDELEAFEKNFPYKEKHVTDTQLKM